MFKIQIDLPDDGLPVVQRRNTNKSIVNPPFYGDKTNEDLQREADIANHAREVELRQDSINEAKLAEWNAFCESRKAAWKANGWGEGV